MRRFLAASAFSFFVLAAVLFWQGYEMTEGMRGDVGKGRIVLCYVAAIFCSILGVAGTRLRHQRLRERDDR